MSGQRVTGVVVGGEEVFAKEVQLLKKHVWGENTSILEIWSKKYEMVRQK